MVVGDFVLVEFKDGLTCKGFYVVQVLKPDDLTKVVEVSFLRNSTKFEGSFRFPAVSDVSMIKMIDIYMLLPPPKENWLNKALEIIL